MTTDVLPCENSPENLEVDDYIDFDASSPVSATTPSPNFHDKENFNTNILNSSAKIEKEPSEGLANDEEKLLNLAAALVSISSLNSSTPISYSDSLEQIRKYDLSDTGPETNGNSSNGTIQAYAKIEGDGWVYFMKKPSCVFGKAPSSDKTFQSSVTSEAVDFYLSYDDIVSPIHLRIEYSPDRLCWEALCLGKIGITVDGILLEPFTHPQPLQLRSIIKVSEVSFSFIQPGPSELSVSASSSNSSRSSTPLSDDCVNYANMKPWKSYDPLKAVRTKPKKPRFQDGSYSGSGEDLVKPSQSYACLIAEAINSVPEKRMTLSGIYQYLADHYPYFRQTKNGWQVNHSSLLLIFFRIPYAIIFH